jgi:hypothetical protein
MKYLQLCHWQAAYVLIMLLSNLFCVCSVSVQLLDAYGFPTGIGTASRLQCKFEVEVEVEAAAREGNARHMTVPLVKSEAVSAGGSSSDQQCGMSSQTWGCRSV